jgi:5-methylcytosine-specific restriction endonuclease McrA
MVLSVDEASDMSRSRPDLSGRRAQRRRAALIASVPAVCVVCLEPIDVTLPASHRDGPTTEHLVAVAAGGSPTSPSNLALSHRRCNTRRGKRSLADARRALAPKPIDRPSRTRT